MEKKNFKIKEIYPKREGESQRGKWSYQDLWLIEDDESKRFPDEFLATFKGDDIEKLAKLKVGDTIKVGMQFGVHEFFPNPNDKEKAYRNTICAGWGVEVVQVSGF